MAADCRNSGNHGAPSATVVEFNDEEMMKIHGNADRTVYVRVSGPKMGRFQLGSCIHRFFKLEARVEVSEHGHCWFSAKFSNDRDYNLATLSGNWQITDGCSIEVYKWQPNFQFGKVPPFSDGDTVEARFDATLPVEYWVVDAVTRIANAVSLSLGCNASGVDTSRGKPPRFWFQLTGSSCYLDLPLHVQISGGLLVGLTYSRAQHCYRCGRVGHVRRTCAYQQLNQCHTSFSNWSSTCSNAVPAQVRHPHLDQEPVPIPPQCQEESSPMEPFSKDRAFLQKKMEEEKANHFASSSRDASRPRLIQTTEMGDKGAMIFENGEESRPTLYNIAEEVSEIDISVKVTHLNDQRGNRRQVSLTPRTGHAPPCPKRLLYTSMGISDIQNEVQQLKDTCNANNVSMAIVLDKSSGLIKDDQIVRCLGFSASHSTEMTFRTFRPDGSALDVMGNCFLMWKREQLHVNVSPIVFGSTELLSQHVQFSASWVVGSDDSSSTEQDSGDSGDSGDSSDISDSTTSVEHNEFPAYAPTGDTDSDESSFFSISGEERPSESSVSSSSNNESSISPPNGDTNSEGSSLFFTASEEFSDQSSAFTRSDLSHESSTFSRNGDSD